MTWMKMICISNNKPKSNGINLTLGGIYEVLPMMHGSYEVSENLYFMRYQLLNPVTGYYWEKELFMSIGEYRELQINSILDE